jgi:alpha-galactosidase
MKNIATLGLLTFALTAPLSYAAETFQVSSLDLQAVEQEWGEAHRDKSVDGNALSVGGFKFEHGVGTHANSSMHIILDGKAERFSATVGVDGEVGQKGSVTFQVVGDGKTLWESGVMRGGGPAKSVLVELQGVKSLELKVGDAGDGIDMDHADWADASLVMTEGKPQVLAAPPETAVVLTPKAAPTPAIHSAKVFGVRPGAPFLYTVAATGDRPMSFSAKGLPKGLQLDASSGRITGSIEKEGSCFVTLRARNARGTAERKLKILCGPQIALTPALGWNSWNCFASAVTAEKVKAAADAMVKSGLINHGWQYINIDDFWEVHRDSKDPTLLGPQRDAEGRILPNPRFPDMKGLADYVHGLGLKIGLYSSPGPWTCGGCVASWQHEEQDARQYGDWGFDYLKYDWCSYSEVAPHINGAPGNGRGFTLETLQKPYRVMRAALDKVPRDILFSFCQYGWGNVWEWGAEAGGNSWRTTGDITDTWRSLSRIGFSQAGHEKYAGPGHFNDPDMMIVGWVGWGPKLHPTRLTPNEQYTHVSLWCLLTAPLLIGCDMTRLDDFTLSLLTNDEVLAVDQDPLGRQAARVSPEGQLEVWAKELEDGSKAVGLFNKGDNETTVTAKWSDVGVNGKQVVRDLWRQKDLGKFDGEFHAAVPRHGVVLVSLRKS